MPVPGLHHSHPRRNLAAVADRVIEAYRGGGPLRLGRRRRLIVLAVDGLGYATAARTLHPAVLEPLTSGFPTTTVASLLTSLTGRPTDEHGVVGVRYLHGDGRRAVDCHTGLLSSPGSPAPARPTRSRRFATIFDTLAALGVTSVGLPGALTGLSAPIRRRLLSGCRLAAIGSSRAAPRDIDLADGVSAVLDLAERHSTSADRLTWVYLDLDTHLHSHGVDDAVYRACRAIDQFAERMSRAGAAVLLYSDHGVTPSAPGPDTLALWREADSPRWCRLPAGGAGRVRWLYPHVAQQDRVLRLVRQLPSAVVATPEQLAGWGLIRAGSVAARRLGEVVLLAHGPDFPAADTAAAFEHGSMTADEVLVPLAIWHAD